MLMAGGQQTGGMMGVGQAGNQLIGQQAQQAQQLQQQGEWGMKYK
jgi:hypothetical protein